MARWGMNGYWLDVTDQLQKLFAGGDAFTPDSKLFGSDPRRGYGKQLQVTVPQDGVKTVLKFPGAKPVATSDFDP